MGGGQVHALAHHGRGHGNAVLGAQGQHALEGVPPGMHGQAEGAVVNGQQPASAQVAVGLHGLGRVHVHIGPVRVVGAGFHQREVEGAEAPADFRKAVEIAAVAAEEDTQRVGACQVLDDPGRPQRAVAVAQAPAREMLGRRGREAQAVHLHVLPPVELAHLLGGHAPGHEPVAHAQRAQEEVDPGRQGADGGTVQMVVVVVREHHAAQRGQFMQGDGRRMKALGADEGKGRGALGKHRVGDPPAAAQFHQQRGVAQAVQAALGRGGQVGRGEPLHGQGRRRLGVLGLVEEEVPHHLGVGLGRVGGAGMDVAKAPAHRLG